MSGFRLESGGRIDRMRRLSFTFDGRAMQGHPGDSLASALLANGVGIVARSFKYHRPRGIMAAGVEEPNAMLAIRDAHGAEPALRAGQVLLSEGLAARSVTGWPSARVDLLAPLTRLAAPFMGAGFYYKTLKWPNWSWYEGAVRKAAGYGQPSGIPGNRLRETRHDSCAVLIIGAGPAGLAAAAALRGAGRRVFLVDDAPEPGGSLLWEEAQVDGRPAAVWAGETARGFETDGGVLLPDTFVTGAYEGNFFTLLQSLRDEGGVRGERLWKLRAEQVILATGAVDRPVVFHNNDRPGVFLSASVRRFIGQYGVAPGQSLAVWTSNDSGYLTALAARAAGLAVTLIDSRSHSGEAALAAVQAAGIEVNHDAQIADTAGSHALRSVTILSGGRRRLIVCDALATCDGHTPLIHLAAHRGSRPVYDESSASFTCPDLPPGWLAAGAVTGAVGLGEVLRQGHEAGVALGGQSDGAPQAECALDLSHGMPVWRSPVGNPKRMWVDFQNDVKVSDITQAARENYTSVEHLKRYTTLGMGTDQGRTSNINGLVVLAAETGHEMASIGTTTFRPPFVATRLGTITQHHERDGFQPRRYLPAHDDHAAHGARFEDFGWERPDWYAENGPDRDSAALVEMQAVRHAVGVFDASPLGKIEVTGPDARDFLNRFYVSNLAGLKPGRIRYSVMCHDDGVIFDDGVVTCIDEHFFLAGPTSGNAETVHAWFERWRQTEWPGLRVSITQATSNWAAVALAGPKARDLLARLTPDFAIDAESLPHMGFTTGALMGVPARVARVSFTGELQFELSVPARYGQALMQRAMEAGEDLGARRIGMEAWLRLRLEKGYLHVGADTNGRTTPPDIGMGTIAARKQADFIGKRALSLPFNRAPDREELVGLRPVAGRIMVGGRILAPGETRIPCRTIGNVTSACDSPEAGNIALALIEGGARRMGEVVRIHADGTITEAEICNPVFIDPENERLRR